MPVRFSFSGRLFRLDLEGNYASADIPVTFDRAAQDPAFPKDARLLIDVRRSAELAERPAQDIREVAQAFASRAHHVGGRCALLAGGPLHYGLMRMASVFTEAPGVQAEVFEDGAEALRWLGLDPALLEGE